MHGRVTASRSTISSSTERSLGSRREARVTKMTRDTAKRLLKRSREVEWAFPTSFSNTNLVRSADSVRLHDLSAERHAVAEAAALLLRNGDEAAALELAANTWRAWLPVRDLDGGRAFLASILEAGPGRPNPSTAHALYGDSVFAIKLGDLDASRSRAQAALTVAAEVGDAEGRVFGLLGLSRVAFEEGNHERAESLAAEARELAGELKASMSQAPQHMLAQSVRASGDLDRAARLFEESLMLNRQIEDEGMISVELFNLGHVEARRGNIDTAEHLFMEAAERIDPSDPYDDAMTRFNRAVIAFGRGDLKRAGELLHRARSTLGEIGADLPSDDQAEFEWLEGRLAVALNPPPP